MTVDFPNELLMDIRALLNNFDDIKVLNEFFKSRTGILNFFRSNTALDEFKRFLDSYNNNQKNRDLGDFQTPRLLSDKICEYISDIGFMPEAVIEPTCGEGNFVASAIKFFPGLKYVYCVDIQPSYEWLLKLKILKKSYINHTNITLEFHRDNIFTHHVSDNFNNYLNTYVKNLLILGNPPWITNSELSTLNSNNLPSKINIKNSKGIDAITGKGNFDIAEYIILQMIQRFSDRNGKIAMLCKTSVIKNIIRYINHLNLRMSNIHELKINAKKEFNINADSAVFLADINSYRQDYCTVLSLYDPSCLIKKYGWIKNKFVSDIKLYKDYGFVDGHSSLIWRQGVKHDASAVMVLKISENGLLTNGLKENVDIESDLIYPIFKGSEIKDSLKGNTDNRVIITQTSIGNDTEYIKSKYPKTWAYLIAHSEYFEKRKSVVYKDKPKFSMFGIGNYAFKPYKIAISGFYKKPDFSLITPIDNKPVMLDDTCYYLSFDEFKHAFFIWTLLKTEEVRKFLSSIVFLDSKRPYTKDVLMRIDLTKLLDNLSYDNLLNIYRSNLKEYRGYRIDEKEFSSFLDFLRKAENQLTFDAVL